MHLRRSQLSHTAVQVFLKAEHSGGSTISPGWPQFVAWSYTAEPLMSCQRGHWRIVYLLKGSLTLLSLPISHSTEMHELAKTTPTAQGFLRQVLQIFCHRI